MSLKMTTAESANCHICFVVFLAYTLLLVTLWQAALKSLQSLLLKHTHTHTKAIPAVQTQVNLDNKISD
jgi:hypothetical protein